MWMSTEECFILRLYPPYQETMVVHPSKETHFCLFYKDFPSFVYEIFPIAYLLSSRCASRGKRHGGVLLGFKPSLLPVRVPSNGISKPSKRSSPGTTASRPD